MGSYSIVAILLLVVCALQQAAAFTSSSSSTVVVRTTATPPAPQYRPTRVHPAFTAASTTTALQLKVKIDPDKANKNEKGNNAMAAYGGSIAIAALFPVLFIIWSLVK